MTLNNGTVNNVEQHSYRSLCPTCGRFLTRSLVRISILSDRKEDIEMVRKKIQIQYGSETKCKRCRQIGTTQKIAEAQI